MLGIIGSAGNRDHGRLVSADVYGCVLDEGRRALRDFRESEAVSGGAAFCDHSAVRLFLDGDITGLTLHLPCGFGRGAGGHPEFDESISCGRTANRLHRQFSETIGADTLEELAAAISRGARVYVHGGFLVRNTPIARASGHLLAMTFSEVPGRHDIPRGQRAPRGLLCDGGTLDTWRKAADIAAIRRHVCLHDFLKTDTPPVQGALF